MPPKSSRSPARFLAPVALIAFAVALVIVIDGGLGGGADDEGGDRAPAATTQPRERTTTQREQRPEPATYTVELNDTLGSIAEETGVPVERIEELNPELDPQALVAGQEIQLRE